MEIPALLPMWLGLPIVAAVLVLSTYLVVCRHFRHVPAAALWLYVAAGAALASMWPQPWWLGVPLRVLASAAATAAAIMVGRANRRLRAAIEAEQELQPPPPPHVTLVLAPAPPGAAELDRSGYRLIRPVIPPPPRPDDGSLPRWSSLN